MHRATKEYKDHMKDIRQTVDLTNRTDLFRAFRAALKGKHQDFLEKSYVKYLETFHSDINAAEKQSMLDTINILFSSGRDPSKCLTGETLRVCEELIPNTSRDILRVMDPQVLKEKITKVVEG